MSTVGPSSAPSAKNAWARCGSGAFLFAALSILAHFGVGLAKSLMTTRPWWISGLEMTAVAVIAVTITYGLGVAFAIH